MDVSVIIPTRDRAQLLDRCLRSLATLDRAPTEILVIDNGSTDSTTEVVASHRARGGDLLRLHHEPIPGLLSGRHRGVKEASGDILVFIDDDVEPDRSWMSAIGEAFADEGTSLVCGPSRARFEIDPPGWWDPFWVHDENGSRCEWLSLLDLGRHPRRVDPSFVWGLNFAIRRTTLEALGGFHPDNMPATLERFQGDGETGLTRKAKASGAVAVYHPEAMVVHVITADRLDVSYLLRRVRYQGICDSFTAVRAGGRPWWSATAWTMLRSSLTRMMRRGRSASDMARAVSKAYVEGYLYHQREVRRDPRLLEWVSRPTYWNYTLPAWEGDQPDAPS